MPLTNIEYGSLASSEVMNDNFEYLDNCITNVATNLAATNSNLNSSIANISSNFSQQNESMRTDISNLEDYAEQIRNDFDSQNNAPDYSLGIGITMPYTVISDGYVYAGVSGFDYFRYVYVNGGMVHGHCGYSGGKSVYSGSLFRVSSGDVVTCEAPQGQYYFYPMKGDSNVL